MLPFEVDTEQKFLKDTPIQETTVSLHTYSTVQKKHCTCLTLSWPKPPYGGLVS